MQKPIMKCLDFTAAKVTEKYKYLTNIYTKYIFFTCIKLILLNKLFNNYSKFHPVHSINQLPINNVQLVCDWRKGYRCFPYIVYVEPAHFVDGRHPNFAIMSVVGGNHYLRDVSKNYLNIQQKFIVFIFYDVFCITE